MSSRECTCIHREECRQCLIYMYTCIFSGVPDIHVYTYLATGRLPLSAKFVLVETARQAPLCGLWAGHIHSTKILEPSAARNCDTRARELYSLWYSSKKLQVWCPVGCACAAKKTSRKVVATLLILFPSIQIGHMRIPRVSLP